MSKALYTCIVIESNSLTFSYLYIIALCPLCPYAEAIHDYCGGNLTVTGVKATAGIFATYPAPYLSLLGGFIDQVALKSG